MKKTLVLTPKPKKTLVLTKKVPTIKNEIYKRPKYSRVAIAKKMKA